MDKIEVGEYIRTIQGYISKVKSIDKDYIHCDSVILEYYDEYTTLPLSKLHEYDMTAEDYITKHSFNIIDLIEEGDYVNGYKVLDIDFKNEMICLLMPFDEENKSKYNIVWNTKYFIKSIVTKQQMEAMGYEVK